MSQSKESPQEAINAARLIFTHQVIGQHLGMTPQEEQAFVDDVLAGAFQRELTPPEPELKYGEFYPSELADVSETTDSGEDLGIHIRGGGPFLLLTPNEVAVFDGQAKMRSEPNRLTKPDTPHKKN